MEIAAEILAELVAELVAELEERAEIRQPEELEVFDSLRLSVVVLAEILVEIFKVEASLVVYCLDSSVS